MEEALQGGPCCILRGCCFLSGVRSPLESFGAESCESSRVRCVPPAQSYRLSFPSRVEAQSRPTLCTEVCAPDPVLCRGESPFHNHCPSSRRFREPFGSRGRRAEGHSLPWSAIEARGFLGKVGLGWSSHWLKASTHSGLLPCLS